MALLKERLKNGEQVLGTMVTTFASPDIAKILQSCGFDFFIVDCEHGAFTTREAANIIAVARGIGMPALVRIPEMRREQIHGDGGVRAASAQYGNSRTGAYAGGLHQIRAHGTPGRFAFASAYGF